MNTSQDTLFKEPYIDMDEWRDQPVRHRYVHGGFTGTETRFSYYFPPKEQYQGRFFQYITPIPDSETLSQGASGEEDKIGFAIDSGAYFVETNGGGPGAAALTGFQTDPSIGAYRANAAAAQYSREVAVTMYGGSRPYGYCFGGSGGAFRTIGGMENTQGVWDGAVPFVPGSPMAIPNVFCVRMHAMRVLKDAFPRIIDALEPGGSGDMYAGLTNEERKALLEVTRMGFPPKSWFGHKTMGVHAFSVLYQGMAMADPQFFEDFWNVPGYLGTDFPESFKGARIQQTGAVKTILTPGKARELVMAAGPMPGQPRGTADAAWQIMEEKGIELPVGLQLVDLLPEVGFLGGDLIIKSGEAAGQKVPIAQVAGDLVIFGMADSRVTTLLQPGDIVQVDNSNFLAAQTYHRHQVPGPEYAVWDQFRSQDGMPIYPQRPMLLGPLFTQNASGTIPSGKFHGKIIMLSSLWDREAFPWQADWYRARVKEHLGDNADEHFVLWYTDRALHGDLEQQEDSTRVVSYLGVLHQALRDLSAWVENGVKPPASTNYQVIEGQVEVPHSAEERKGIQPVVTLTANGRDSITVKTGQSFSLEGQITVPPQAGQVVYAEFDFDGSGTFPDEASLVPLDGTGTAVKVRMYHSYKEPGTYFPTLRAVSNRSGQKSNSFAQIKNLARVRVIVQ